LHKKGDDLPLPSGTAIEQPEGPAQEMEMKYSKQLAAWAMRIPMEQSAKAEGAAEFLGILRWVVYFLVTRGVLQLCRFMFPQQRW